jgi:hypothetical protein
MVTGNGDRIAVRVVYAPSLSMFLTALPPTETPCGRWYL